MPYLVLVRHGLSEWNKLGRFTGLTDVGLAPEGVAEATRAATAISDLVLHRAHVSTLRRARETLTHILATLGQPDLPVHVHPALNERHYGVHVGKSKQEVRAALGEEEFLKLRRHWDHPVPGGETLRAVYERVAPYYEQHVRPDLVAGRNTLVVAHGNTLRVLIKHLEEIPDADIAQVEVSTGEVRCYEFDDEVATCRVAVRATNAIP
jgi:2,3-bisphosphoglycerate-dependent phosphoglycerate mutase